MLRTVFAALAFVALASACSSSNCPTTVASGEVLPIEQVYGTDPALWPESPDCATICANFKPAAMVSSCSVDGGLEVDGGPFIACAWTEVQNCPGPDAG